MENQKMMIDNSAVSLPSLLDLIYSFIQTGALLNTEGVDCISSKNFNPASVCVSHMCMHVCVVCVCGWVCLRACVHAKTPHMCVSSVVHLCVLAADVSGFTFPSSYSRTLGKQQDKKKMPLFISFGFPRKK